MQLIHLLISGLIFPTSPLHAFGLWKLPFHSESCCDFDRFVGDLIIADHIFVAVIRMD